MLLDSRLATVVARDFAARLGLPYNAHWNGLQLHEDDNRLIVVMPMIVNWRLVEAPPGEALFWNRAWCYDGPVRALAYGVAWIESEEDCPKGWKKEVHTGRYPAEFEETERNQK